MIYFASSNLVGMPLLLYSLFIVYQMEATSAPQAAQPPKRAGWGKPTVLKPTPVTSADSRPAVSEILVTFVQFSLVVTLYI